MSVKPSDLLTLAANHAREAGYALVNEQDPARAIHLARRRIKRARSLLRALKRLAPREIAEANAHLRGHAHTLAPLRDAHAMDEAAAAIDATTGLRVPGASTLDFGLIARGLERDSRQIQTIPLAASSPDLVAHAVVRSYRRARKAFAVFEETRSTEALHDARKRIKDCQHLVEALGRVKPTRAGPNLDRLDELGDLLGAVRDLGILARKLKSDGATPHKLDRLKARRHRLTRDAERAAAMAFKHKAGTMHRAWLSAVA